MAVATINWALLLITGSLSLLDLCKYANATLIHTSNYVPFNMWQSGTPSLWLTGKSVGSVKNLRNDSALKRPCRETTTNDDRAARLCLLSSTVWLIQVFVSLSVETCWKYAASPSCLYLPAHTQNKHMQIELFHQVSLETPCIAVRLLSANLHEVKFFQNPEKATEWKCVLHCSLHCSSLVFCKQPQSFMVKTNKIP